MYVTLKEISESYGLDFDDINSDFPISLAKKYISYSKSIINQTLNGDFSNSIITQSIYLNNDFEFFLPIENLQKEDIISLKNKENEENVDYKLTSNNIFTLIKVNSNVKELEIRYNNKEESSFIFKLRELAKKIVYSKYLEKQIQNDNLDTENVVLGSIRTFSKTALDNKLEKIQNEINNEFLNIKGNILNWGN